MAYPEKFDPRTCEASSWPTLSEMGVSKATSADLCKSSSSASGRYCRACEIAELSANLEFVGEASVSSKGQASFAGGGMADSVTKLGN